MLVDEDGNGDFLDHFLGKPTPDWQGSFGFNIVFLKNFRFTSLFEYKAGNFFVSNLTDAFRKSHPLIGRNIRRAAELEAILLNSDSTPEERLAAANEWVRKFQALAPYSGLNTIEKADFLAIRELSLTYQFPRRLASNLGVDNASITFSVRNLHKFTSYSGIDPETNAIGRGGDVGLDREFLDSTDAFGLPIPRQFIFTLRLSF